MLAKMLATVTVLTLAPGQLIDIVVNASTFNVAGAVIFDNSITCLK
jgi:hypothetical protein